MDIITEATFEVVFEDGNIFYAYECKSAEEAVQQALENNLIDHNYDAYDIKSVRIMGWKND